MLKHIALALCLVSSAAAARAQGCPWMAEGRIDKAFPGRAPWGTMAGGQGRCKFISSGTEPPPSTVSVTQILKASPEEAAKYVKTVGGGMAKSYAVSPLAALGTEGVAVRETSGDGRMLTLIGHAKNVVVMTQMSFPGGVKDAERDAAVALTQEAFALDTGGGLQMPSP